MSREDRQLEICPYDPAHVIIKSRMFTHLARCGKNYPNANKIPCSFNGLHIIPEPEMKYHLENCPDRVKMDRFMYKSGDIECPVKNTLPINIETPEADENWDEGPQTRSFLDVVPLVLESKPIMRVSECNGLSKAKRKAFRNNERMRIQNLQDKQPVLSQVQERKQVNESGPARLPNKLTVLRNMDRRNQNGKPDSDKGSSSSALYSSAFRTENESRGRGRLTKEPMEGDLVPLGKGMKQRSTLMMESAAGSLVGDKYNRNTSNVHNATNGNRFEMNDDGFLAGPIPGRGRGQYVQPNNNYY